jgi:methylenetetrahydrofolate dehydrogenase (NADP+)/methenyltetrahydrofolate cyclohydrolase
LRKTLEFILSHLLTASEIKQSYIPHLKERCEKLKQDGFTPNLAVVLVGNNSASLSYIKNKEKVCKEVGAEFQLIQLDSNVSESEFTKTISDLDSNNSINGIIVQLPVSEQLKHIDIANLVSSAKDVDGFGKTSIFRLFSNRMENTLISCTPKGIIRILDHYKVELSGKNVAVIGRSAIVGKPVSMLLTNRNATVTLCHSRTENLKEITKKSDIIIAAIGSAKFLTEDYLSSNQIIIDVGINQDEHGKLCGDVDFENVKDKCAMITPVPGGVGPMTVISLIDNLLLATENQVKVD